MFKHDMQNTWKVIKQAMNLTKGRSDINKIKYNNETVENSKDIANIFNNYFSSIGNNLAENIPTSNKNYTDFLGPANPNSIFFFPTNRQEVHNIVSNLQNKTKFWLRWN